MDNRKVEQRRLDSLLFPNDEADTWALRFQTHMAQVRAAARFLDEAKVPFLRCEATAERVLAANRKWQSAIERVL